VQYLVDPPEYGTVELGQRRQWAHVAEDGLGLDLPHPQRSEQVQTLLIGTSNDCGRGNAELSDLFVAVDELVELVGDDPLDGVVVVVVGGEFGLAGVEDVEQGFGVEQHVAVLLPARVLTARVLRSHRFDALAHECGPVH